MVYMKNRMASIASLHFLRRERVRSSPRCEVEMTEGGNATCMMADLECIRIYLLAMIQPHEARPKKRRPARPPFLPAT